MEQIGVLNRVSTVDALIQAFSNEIINGAWEPGVYCKDTDMAEKYGVSRNSVREAFSVLVEKGLLKRRNNKGFFVPVLGEEDVRELYEARLVIELAVIEEITKRREVPSGMYEALDSLKLKTEEDLRNYILAPDFDFHMNMVQAIGNSRIMDMFEKLFMETQIINRQPHLYFSIDFIISEHEKIIEKILSGDVNDAKTVMKKHIDISIERQIKELCARK